MSDYNAVNAYNFCDFEEKNGLLEDYYKEFNYWGYIRFEVFSGLKMLSIQSGRSDKVRQLSLKDYCNWIYNLTINNPVFRFRKKDALVIAHPRRLLEEGKYKCIYTDFLAEDWDKKCGFSEFLYADTHLKPCKNKEVMYLDYIEILPSFLYKINKYGRKEPSILEIAHKINIAIKKYFGINLNEEELSEKITKYYFYYKIRKKMIIRLLKRVSPKIIIEVVGYEFNKMVLNEAAKELRIPTVELQHGVIGRGHIAYNYKVNRRYKYLPDKLFVFSNYWKQTCKFPIGEDKICAVGYPYLEEQKDKYLPEKSEKLTILVLSQPFLYAQKIHDYIKSLCDILKKKSIKFKLIYKLHPSEFGRNEYMYQDFCNDLNVELVNNSAKSLYYFFSVSDIQVGATSTAIFEGLAYNLKTYIIDFPDVREYMGDLCEAGYATICSSPEELADCISQGISEINECRDEGYFFEKGAKKNIIRELNRFFN